MAREINYDLKHLRNTLAAEQAIDKIYRKVVAKVLKLGIDRVNVDEALFSFDADKVLSRRYAAEEKTLVEGILSAIESGERTSWSIANDKVDQLVTSKLGMTAATVNEKIRNRYFSHNDAALAAFLQRKSGGLGLSERVWHYADQFKEEIELSIDVALRDGRSADELSRDVRAYLADTAKLFRRVRDVHGNLVLSKAAKAYHPGRGVYRSSYKNARRLAATEINMAFHRAAFDRWQQLDMVVGFRVVTSNNHPTPDICDDLKGDYPKTFLFTGWHPHCRCHTEPILKTIEEIKADNGAIMQGQEPTGGSLNTVRTVPRGFSDWINDHAEQIEAAHARGNLPYFISDNKSTVSSILGDIPRNQTPRFNISKGFP